MKISKRSQNQKKRSNSKKGGARKQRGASEPNVVRQFNVYYNYILSNFQNEGGQNGDLLTRQLNTYELDVCQQNMEEDLDNIINDVDPQYKDLSLGVITQLIPPHNGKHFRINITVRNKTDEEATKLIREYMEEVYASRYTEFDLPIYRVHESDDQNRYYSDPGNQIDIENVVAGGYQKKRLI
jgi:hypothetical protein